MQKIRIGSGNVLNLRCLADNLISAARAQGRCYLGYVVFEVMSIYQGRGRGRVFKTREMNEISRKEQREEKVINP